MELLAHAAPPPRVHDEVVIRHLDEHLVVVEKRPAAKRGDIVVAIVDNQYTLKRLDVESGRFVLKPENKAYPIIRPEGTLEIFGVMVGLVRKL